MSKISENISGGDFIATMNGLVEGLALSASHSASQVISRLNTAFAGLTGRRTLVDRSAPGFIADVNYNLDLMDSGDTPEPVTEKITLPTDRLPRLLFIGNSFSLDSISYLPFILKAHGIEAIVAICFRHGKTVDWYNSVYDSTTASDRKCYLYACDNTASSPQWHDFGVQKDSTLLNAEWVFDNPHDAVTATNAGLAEYMGSDANAVLLDGTWDMISIQSFGAESYSGSTLETNFPSLVSKLVADFGSDFALGFTMPSHVVVTVRQKAS